MDKSKTSNKRKLVFNYLYATLVGLLVVACAVTIALVSANNATQPNANIGGGEVVPVATVSYVLPMRDATVAKDYSGTELQYNATLKQWEIHKAIDFLAGENLNVYAVTDGTVSNIYTNYLEGTVIEIAHSNGLVSIYKSLASEVQVTIGEKVTSGQVIGVASNSMAQELSVGAHLHFEMQQNGIKIDPNNYIELGVK